MAAYDLDNLLTDIGSVITDNLNTKIAEINTEKGDSLLTTVDSDAVYKQTLRLQTVAYSPYIFYGITSIENISTNGPMSAMNVLVDIGIVLRDEAADTQIISKMFRYHRALKEIFEDDWILAENSIKMSVSNLAPVEFTRLGDETNHRVIGIQINATIP